MLTLSNSEHEKVLTVVKGVYSNLKVHILHPTLCLSMGEAGSFTWIGLCFLFYKTEK